MFRQKANNVSYTQYVRISALFLKAFSQPYTSAEEILDKVIVIENVIHTV
jgi:hypothetical protein